jgi:hypothetical protein
MTIKEQIEIMESQLGNFDSPMDKMAYMSNFFDSDPQFTREARDEVRGNICKNLPKE